MDFHPSCKSVSLNSLCFVDDLILLSRGTIKSFSILLEELHLFLKATGLCINKAKSSLYTCGVEDGLKKTLMQLANVGEGSFPLTYLGVPLKPTKWNKQDYAKVVDKIRKIITSWGVRHLSFVGRVQLISSVIFGIRSYWMSVFCSPASVVKDIDKLCRNFLWGDKDDKRKMHNIA